MDKNEHNDFSYRPYGELEQRGFERLPPTPISAEANNKLKKWGIPEELIAELRDFCSSFRYDLCAERVARLAMQPAYILTDGKNESVDLPHFFEVNSRLDGECSNVGRQFLLQLEVSGLIGDLNELTSLPEGYRIVPTYHTGNSKTHFSVEKSNHVWNGLKLVNDLGGGVDSVLIDLAFQQIQTQQESGYKQKSAVIDPKMVYSELNKSIQIGTFEIHDDGWSGRAPYTAVIGISRDRYFVYSLGFARITEKKQFTLQKLLRRLKRPDPVAVLHRITPDAKSSFFFLHPESKELMSSEDDTQSGHESASEVLRILQAANFKFSDDLESYPRKHNDRQHIKWIE